MRKKSMKEAITFPSPLRTNKLFSGDISNFGDIT